MNLQNILFQILSFFGPVFLIVAIALLVIYYVFLVRAIIEMLRRDTNMVLMAFAFLALIPIPPLVIMGILVIIIWLIYKRTIPAAS